MTQTSGLAHTHDRKHITRDKRQTHKSVECCYWAETFLIFQRLKGDARNCAAASLNELGGIFLFPFKPMHTHNKGEGVYRHALILLLWLDHFVCLYLSVLF
jgi:hypothetical protein